MPPSRDSFDDDQLIRYLLGSLPEEETDRLDEASVIDDDLAARLRLAEDDLVDAYASGVLSGDTLARFESFYLASPRRRKKAAFAKSLLAGIGGSEQGQPAVPQGAAVKSETRRRVVPWSLAAAAVLVLTLGALLLHDAHLRRDLNAAAGQLAAADQRRAAMSAEIEEQKKTAAAATQALAEARAARPFATVALLLQPQTRGIGPTPTISVTSATRHVPLDLEIEGGRPASYEVALKDPASSRTIWRSTALRPRGEPRTPVVPVDIPAELLKPQHYALDLFALRAGSTPEFVGSYAFEVARR